MNILKHKLLNASCLENSNLLVVGIGKTGASIIEFLYNKGLSFRVIDSRENPPNLDSVRAKCSQVILGGLFEEHFIWADTIILSPGVSINESVIKNARENSKVVIGDIELFLNEVDAQVVAITGSNGKSTVTSMMDCIGSYSKKEISIGGNIGIPALDLLSTNSDLYVLELSSFQIETIDSMIFDSSVILNLSEDHMDRYESFEDYCLAKLKLLSGNNNFILNFDDTVIHQYHRLFEHKQNIYWFTLNAPEKNQYGVVSENDSKWICVNQDGELIKIFNCSVMDVLGDHNITNAMVAIIISRLNGIESKAIIEGLTQFTGLSHRNQLIRNSNGVKWINDSKATNVAASCAAILGFKQQPLILIMGGQSKGQNFSKLNTVITSNVKLILLFGEDALLIQNDLNNSFEVNIMPDLRTAVEFASNTVSSGDVVLFSPACASFDMFENFEHRGNSFINLVEELA